jgi:hypothetical protein
MRVFFSFCSQFDSILFHSSIVQLKTFFTVVVNPFLTDFLFLLPERYSLNEKILETLFTILNNMVKKTFAPIYFRDRCQKSGCARSSREFFAPRIIYYFSRSSRNMSSNPLTKATAPTDFVMIRMHLSSENIQFIPSAFAHQIVSFRNAVEYQSTENEIKKRFLASRREMMT